MGLPVLVWGCCLLFLQHDSTHGAVDAHGLQLDKLQRLAAATGISNSSQASEMAIANLTQLKDLNPNEELYLSLIHI